jgi:hypothetical protein
MQFEYENPKTGPKYFFRDLWVMLLDGLAHMASIPGMFLKRMADGVREWEGDGNGLLGVITVVGCLFLSISTLIWLGMKPSPNSILMERIHALEAENAQLKASPGAATRIALSQSGSGTVITALVPTPTPTPGPIEIYQDLQIVVNETKATLKELETELKEAKAKPSEAERELTEIQSEITEYKNDLKQQEKEMRAAQKAISAK